MFYLRRNESAILYSLTNIAKITGGNVKGSGKNEVPAHSFFIDSRASYHSDSLFFALKGDHFDGHHFISELVKNGVRHFVVEKPFDFSSYPDSHFVIVQNTRQALQTLAAHHRQQFNYPVIGITGSNGKTIVKEWLFQLLTTDYSIVKSPKSYNSQVGVPLSVFQMDSHYNLAIFEAGISKSGEMSRLQQIIQPDVGILTTIGPAHNQGFDSLQQKLLEKITLFKNSTSVIYREDHELIKQTLSSHFSRERRIAWKLADRLFQYKDTIPIPEHLSGISAENIGHCIALMICLGFTKETITEKISKVQNIPHRLQLLKGKKNSKIINDSYNNDFSGLKVALEFAQQQSSQEGVTLILSEFEQTGLKDTDTANQLSGLLKNFSLNQFIGVGEFFYENRNHVEVDAKQQTFFHITEGLLNHLGTLDFSGNTVLIKGARNFQLERVSQQLEEKTHDTVWEVNLSAFSNNIQVFRGFLNPSVKLLVMVKAFGYGTSARQVARLMQYENIDYLGVAYAEEGKELREQGITTPVLVLNTSRQTFPTIIQHQLEPETYSLRHLEQLIDFLHENDIHSYPIHIKLDTGMHRLGFEKEDLPELTELLQDESILVKGIFSHLSSADLPQEEAFTLKQQHLFEEMVNDILPFCKNKPLLHLLNSAGITQKNRKQYDMVRLGIGAYGIHSDPLIQARLVQVGTLKATISQIKQIPAGASVGYGRAFRAKKPMRIGTITIGYADGYDRRFGNGVGSVLLHGKKANTVGAVCMDMTMIDLTDIENAKEGDEVIVTSPDLPIKDLAQRIGTIPYELLTNISARVPREFIYE